MPPRRKPRAPVSQASNASKKIGSSEEISHAIIHYSGHRCPDSFWRMDFAANLTRIRERIAAACARANRDPSSVTMLAVTKTQPPEVVSQAAHLGLTLFGENKVQEAKSKIPLCSDRLRWHLIGHLQTN